MVKQRGLRLVRIILLTLAALLLAAGLAGVFSGWKIAFLGYCVRRHGSTGPRTQRGGRQR